MSENDKNKNQNLSQEGEPMQARRRVPRRPFYNQIGLLIAGHYFVTYALELGEGGMLIEHSGELKIDQRLVVTLRIPGVLQGALSCHVVYELDAVKKDGGKRFGLHFDKIEFDLKRKIRNFVASSTGSYVIRTEAEEQELRKTS